MNTKSKIHIIDGVTQRCLCIYLFQSSSKQGTELIFSSMEARVGKV